jgi:hypothetical protein
LRTYAFGTDQVVADPLRDVRVSFCPSPGFRLRRLVVQPEVAERFVITGITFGKRNQLLCPGAVPAQLFLPSLTNHYDFDELALGEEIEVSATNISEKRAPFSMAAVGDGESRDPHSSQFQSFIGLGVTTVRPQKTANVFITPALNFLADELLVPSSVAAHFLINGIRVGNRDQTRGACAPASMFAETCPRRKNIALEMCHRNVFLAIAVENTSDVPRNFMGALAGTFFRSES